MEFDPSVTASHKVGIFGLPATRNAARLILLPVPWEVTTSYGGGTSEGPEAILKASPQIDLFDLETGAAYEAGYHMLPVPEKLKALNGRLRPLALEVRSELEETGKLGAKGQKALAEVNSGCDEMVEWVFSHTRDLLKEGKLVGLIGGDHSSPEGAIRAVSESCNGEFGVLHIDAHADLREEYQGFKHSHASIMNNVMRAGWKPEMLVQVGIRDFCQEEYELIRGRKDIKTFFDIELKRELLAGTNWSALCRQIIDALPKQVYISFDIDGLSPEFCPHTGTPVPGGLSFDQALYLFSALVKSGRRIVGFDLNEVAPGSDGNEWDGNVGARLLFKLCGWTIVAQKAQGKG
jgi:agmatinase